MRKSKSDGLYIHMEMILEWTSFYTTNYGLKGIIFSDDGADCVYCIKPDGAITCFNSIDKDEIQIADTLWDFFDYTSHLSGNYMEQQIDRQGEF